MIFDSRKASTVKLKLVHIAFLSLTVELSVLTRPNSDYRLITDSVAFGQSLLSFHTCRIINLFQDQDMRNDRKFRIELIFFLFEAS